jgi:glycosyltransferase involved in cell wall biosynthesis
MFASWFGGLSYSLTLHGPLGYYGPGQRWKWKSAAFGIVVTRRLRGELLAAVADLEEDRVEVAAMGVDPSVFRRSSGQAVRRPSEEFRVVSCGRLHIGKGHQDVIRAVKTLRRRGVDAHLRILGDGPARKTLAELVRSEGLREDVELLGAVDEVRVRRELEAAHVFVLASHEEAIGVATMEAMAMGLPVVVTDVGGVSELVRDGVDGIMVPPGDPERIAQALATIEEDPSLGVRLGEAGAVRVHEHFSCKRSAEVLAGRLRSIGILS